MKKKKNKYAPIYPSLKKNPDGGKVRLEEVKKFYTKPMKLIENAVSLVGSVVMHGKSDNDFEALIRIPPREQLLRRIIFRLDRAIPDMAMRRKMHPLDDYWGPFTDAIPLYDLVLVPSEMSELKMAIQDFLLEQVRAKSPKSKAQADKAKKSDKITLGEFFLPIKTSISPLMGYRVGERYSVKSMIDYLKKIAERKKLATEIPSCIIQKKYDGISTEIHRDGNKVTIYSDDGSDLTSSLPTIVDEIKKIKQRQFIFIGELELWKDGKHQPRELVKGEKSDEEKIINVHTLLWNEKQGDLHNLEETERIKLLNQIDFSQMTAGKPDLKKGHLNLAPTSFVDTAKEAERALNYFSKSIASEGAMVKFTDMKYSLTGMTTQILKLKTYAELHTIVWKVNTTKIPTVFNYDFALSFAASDKPNPDSIVEIKGKKYSKAGRSYDTTVKCDIGDVITIRFHAINKYKDPETGEISYHLYEPIFSEKRGPKEEPDSFTSADKVGRESGLMIEKAAAEKFAKEGKDELEEALHFALPHPSGKTRIAEKIVKKIPKYKTYVEPFCGAAAVFFHKKKEGKEILNDLNPDIHFCMKFVQSASEDTIKNIEQKVWISSRSKWISLKDNESSGASTDKFHRLVYLQKFSYGKKGIPGGYDPNSEGKDGTPKNLKELKERLKGVEILHQDYKEIVRKFDSADTFFYLDPPYPRSSVSKQLWENAVDEDEFEKTLSKIKGKWLLSYATTKRFKNFEKHTISLPDFMRGGRTDGGPVRTEALISNYKPQNGIDYLLEAFIDKFSEQEDPYMVYPPEDKTYRGIFQRHYRGRTEHIDQRNENVAKLLIGWTIADLIEGKIKEPILTLAQAKATDKKDYFKINLNTGEWKKRLKKGAVKEVNVEVVSFKKAPEPHEWLEVEGVVPKGEVGATKEYPGVFTIPVKGTVEYGMQKPYAHEYFYDMDPVKYRILFRRLRLRGSKIELDGDDEIEEGEILGLAEQKVLPAKIKALGREEKGQVGWVAIKPIVQEPYVLSAGARKKNWLPPLGISALPKKIRAKVPDNLRYWKAKSKESALKIRDELVKYFREKKIDFKEATLQEAVATGKFVVQHHFWKKVEVVRKGPSVEHWDLRIQKGKDPDLIHFVCEYSPTEQDKVSCYQKPCRDGEAMTKGKKIEKLEPGTKWNPTRDTPAWISIIDSGPVTVLEDKDTFKKFQFKGKRFRGLWVITRETPKAEWWILKRSVLPKPK